MYTARYRMNTPGNMHSNRASNATLRIVSRWRHATKKPETPPVLMQYND